MCTKYFTIDNLLEVFHLAIDSRRHGVKRSSLILLFFIAKSSSSLRNIIYIYKVCHSDVHDPVSKHLHA